MQSLQKNVEENKLKCRDINSCEKCSISSIVIFKYRSLQDLKRTILKLKILCTKQDFPMSEIILYFYNLYS